MFSNSQFTMNASVKCISMLLVLSVTQAGAQTPVRTGVLTLEEAVRTALRGNHDLAAARMDVEKAEARVSEAWGYALPRLDVSARYSRAIKKPVFFLPDFNDLSSGRVMPIEIGSTNSFDMTFTASQVLFNSAVFTGVGTAHVYARVAQEMYRAKTVEVVTGVRKAYYGALLAAKVAGVARENLTNAEDNLRRVTLLASQGLVAEYDRLRATVGVENLRPEVTRAENAATLAVNALRIAMGVPFADTLEVRGDIGFEPVDSTVVAGAQGAVLTANPSLAALRYQVEVSDAFIAVERSNYLPSLSAFGNYQMQAQKNDLRMSTRDIVASSLVGVSLSLNIFNGLQTNARVEQAQVDMRKVQEQITGLELQLRTGVESATLQLHRIRQRIGAQEETIHTAERGYAIAAARYGNGSGTQLEVNDARLALAQARLNLAQTHYEYLVASADLDQILGRLPSYAVGETQ